MEVALAVVTDLKIAVFAALGLVTLRLWRRHRGRAAGWVAATFGLAAVVASFGLVPTQEVNRHLWLSKTLVVGIILFPFLLYRFTAALGGPSRGADRLAVSLTALAVGWTLVVPRFPKGPGALRGWFLAYTLIALFQWTLLSLLVTIRLWRGGRGHPGVVLRRMQLLAFGATGIEVAIVIFALTPGTRAQALQFAHHFLALASFVFFYLGFSPPRPLRVTWRQPEVEAGRQAAQALMTVTDRREVTDIMGSSILAMLGARGVALMDTEGQLMWSWGVAPEMAQALARPSPPGGKSPRHAEDVIRVPSQMGCAVIWASPYTPFFGQEEIDLVRYQGVLGDLALERVELLEREREARLVAERAKTELESLLHRLREAEERYRAVFENAAEGMAQSAPDGRWVMVNPAMARMFGYGSPEELVTEVPDARQLWADPGRRKELLRLLASSDTVRDFAVEIRRKDGATVEISAGVAALRDVDGKIANLVSIFVDITEHKSLERALREAYDREREARLAAEQARVELESFLYTVSHDLRSPLVSVMGYLDYLRDDYADKLDEEGIRYLERMSASANYMQELISDLLELSRIGRMQTEREDVDLTSIVGSITQEIRVSHPEASFDVGPLPAVYMNPVRAQQLFTNLLDNAVQHGGRSDLKVRVSAHHSPEGLITVSVADNGRGVPSEHRDRTFGIFERLEGPDGAGTGGTGIGLAVCKRIVEGIGGKIWFADSAEGADVRILFLPSVCPSHGSGCEP